MKRLLLLFPSFVLATGFFCFGIKDELNGIRIRTECFATSSRPVEQVIPSMYSARHQPPAANLPAAPPGANPYDYADGPTFTQQLVMQASGGGDLLGGIQDLLGLPNWQRNATPYVTFFNRGNVPGGAAPPQYVAVFPTDPCRPANLDDTMHYWSVDLSAPIQSKGSVPTAQEIYQARWKGFGEATPLEQPWTWQNPSFMDRAKFYYHVLIGQ